MELHLSWKRPLDLLKITVLVSGFSALICCFLFSHNVHKSTCNFISLHAGVKIEGILRQAADVDDVEHRIREYEQGLLHVFYLFFFFLISGTVNFQSNTYSRHLAQGERTSLPRKMLMLLLIVLRYVLDLEYATCHYNAFSLLKSL